MKGIAQTIHYGKTQIDYKLLIMNRQSLEIAVHPDKSIIVKAPSSAAIELIEERIKKRARWIKRQIAYFSQFEPRTPDRQYVGGESHLYLGRKYRLKIEDADKDNVLLKNGYIYLEVTSRKLNHIQQLMDLWYRKRAKTCLPQIFDDCWENFKTGNLNKPYLKLQKMNTRWGSLSTKGQLTLNLKLIQTPKACIEYVVMHELCHLVHLNHGAEFYKLLERIMPDWVKRKHKLEMSLV